MTNFIDKLIIEIDKGIKFSSQNQQVSERPYPAEGTQNQQLTESEINHSGGLMRVNHSGEVCAQALYRGQSLTAELNQTRQQMEKAAEEELDHIAWCNKRLEELGESPSVLNPLWYALSFSLGAVAGLIGDKWSLGFVEETEEQVVKHLENHMKSVPTNDKKTMEVIKQMRIDEKGHSEEAKKSGAEELPKEIKILMKTVAKIMTKISYQI